MIVNQFREYLKDSTASTIFINGRKVCYALEDVARPIGVKIEKETCIPEGVYNAKVSYSSRFNRKMVMLENKPNGVIHRLGVSYSGIRIHGGNSVEDTSGCILVAYYRDIENNKIWGSAENEITQIIHGRQEECFWVINSFEGMSYG